MKLETIRETLKNKSLKKEFALLTNLINGESEIFFPGHDLSEMFSKYSEEIEKIFNLNKSGIIENSEIFVQTYKNPIKVIIVGAVDISIYLIDFAKNLNFEINLNMLNNHPPNLILSNLPSTLLFLLKIGGAK